MNLLKLKRIWNSIKCFCDIHDYYYQMKIFEKEYDKFCVYKVYVCKNCGDVYKEFMYSIPIKSYKSEMILIEMLKRRKIRTLQEFHKYYFCFLRPKLYRIASGLVF